VAELSELYAERLPLLEEVARRLEDDLIEHFTGQPRIDRLGFRAKGVDSFVEKAEAPRREHPYGAPLAEIEDQIAGRILVHFTDDVVSAVDHLGRLFTPVEQEHRRPTRYNEFDYESFHGIYILAPQYLPSGWGELEDMPRTFEMQVRTLLQHAYAEPQHDLGYKPETSLDDAVRRELAWIAAGCWGADQAFERVRSKLRE
jgi:putative GTP pyrophosphokinase